MLRVTPLQSATGTVVRRRDEIGRLQYNDVYGTYYAAAVFPNVRSAYHNNDTITRANNAFPSIIKFVTYSAHGTKAVRFIFACRIIIKIHNTFVRVTNAPRGGIDT